MANEIRQIKGFDGNNYIIKDASALSTISVSTTSLTGSYRGGTTFSVNMPFLPKTTYEWNKELAFGNSGKLCIGKFCMYDTQIMVDINSTTSTTYHGILLIATQNKGTSGGGTILAKVYGDATNTVAPNIKIYNHGPNDAAVEIYFSPPAWSKNLIHILALALRNTGTTKYPSWDGPNLYTEICTNVSAVPEEATLIPTNVLRTTFSQIGHTHSISSSTTHSHNVSNLSFTYDGDEGITFLNTTISTESSTVSISGYTGT